MLRSGGVDFETSGTRPLGVGLFLQPIDLDRSHTGGIVFLATGFLRAEVLMIPTLRSGLR